MSFLKKLREKSEPSAVVSAPAEVGEEEVAPVDDGIFAKIEGNDIDGYVVFIKRTDGYREYQLASTFNSFGRAIEYRFKTHSLAVKAARAEINKIRTDIKEAAERERLRQETAKTTVIK